MAECRIDVRFFAPPADIAPCFTSFYRIEIDLPEGETVIDYLQPEWANLRYFASNPPNASVAGGPQIGPRRFQATGPSSRPSRFEIGKTRTWGIGLMPLGWARFVGAVAGDHVNLGFDGEQSELFAPFVPLCDILCVEDGDDDDQFEQLVAFFRTLAEPPRDAEKILTIHEVMFDPYLLHVEDFAARTGFSKRTLERLCHRHFGFSPRLLLRRQRLMRTLAAFMIEGGSWTSVIDRHYHDQAHFVHEFQAFMGMSPSEYAAMPHPILGAFMAERQRVWGSPVQTLDKPR